MKTWKEIWESRSIEDLNHSNINKTNIINNLLKTDGFDSETGKIEVNAWLEFISKLVQRLDIQKTDSIFEIGCGAGAFLYPFYENGNMIGGLDYANNLIEICKKTFKNENFITSQAQDLDINPKYDYVVAFSVLFYFPNLEYTEFVIKKMYEKACKGVLLFDIPNIKTKKECENARKGTLSHEEYTKKYLGLSHLYYDKDFFKNISSNLNAQKIIIEDQNIESYFNNKFRFNCFLLK